MKSRDIVTNLFVAESRASYRFLSLLSLVLSVQCCDLLDNCRSLVSVYLVMQAESSSYLVCITAPSSPQMFARGISPINQPRLALLHTTGLRRSSPIAGTTTPPPSSQLSTPPVVPAATTSVPLSTPRIALEASSSSSSSNSSGSSGNGKAKKPKHRLRTFARVVLAAVVGSSAFVVWHSYEKRHPGEQLPYDPSLPTVVVAGNGWGSTAFLKGFDNEGYNVVSGNLV